MNKLLYFGGVAFISIGVGLLSLDAYKQGEKAGKDATVWTEADKSIISDPVTDGTSTRE